MQNQYYYLAVFEDIRTLISYWNCFLVWAKSIAVEMVIEKKKRKLKDVFHKVDSRNCNAYSAIFFNVSWSWQCICHCKMSNNSRQSFVSKCS